MARIDPIDLRLDRLEQALDAKDLTAARALNNYVEDWFTYTSELLNPEREVRHRELTNRPEWDATLSIDSIDLRMDRIEKALDAVDPLLARAFKQYMDAWFSQYPEDMTTERNERQCRLILRREWDRDYNGSGV